jgi:hypothetical protein
LYGLNARQAVKFDAGGGNDDMNRWAKELNASGRQIMIENCNNGGYVPYPFKSANGKPLPTPPAAGDGCPFNMFRVGIDNSPSPLSMVSNLMDASKYLAVSRPGCWASATFALSQSSRQGCTCVLKADAVWVLEGLVWG